MEPWNFAKEELRHTVLFFIFEDLSEQEFGGWDFDGGWAIFLFGWEAEAETRDFLKLLPVVNGLGAGYFWDEGMFFGYFCKISELLFIEGVEVWEFASWSV